MFCDHLSAHYWLNGVDEDEVGLKKSQTTLDNQTITSKGDPKHRECGLIKDLIPNVMPLLRTADSEMGRVFTP